MCIINEYLSCCNIFHFFDNAIIHRLMYLFYHRYTILYSMSIHFGYITYHIYEYLLNCCRWIIIEYKIADCIEKLKQFFNFIKSMYHMYWQRRHSFIIFEIFDFYKKQFIKTCSGRPKKALVSNTMTRLTNNCNYVLLLCFTTLLQYLT